MGIGPETRAYFKSTLQKAIASFYGDRVLSLDGFRNKRRATYMARLEEVVDAKGWREKIAKAVEVRGHKQAAVTRMQNEQQAKQNELKAKHDLEKQQLYAKQQSEYAALVAHYETPLLDARNEYDAADKVVSATERESYFAALGIEDDHRQLYRSSDINGAIKERVDSYIDQHLMEDEEGAAVQTRANQEQLIADACYIADKTSDLRDLVLHFIRLGKLPNITVEAWLIENGKDMRDAS